MSALDVGRGVSEEMFCKDLQWLTDDPYELLDLRDDVLDRMRPRDAVEAEMVEHYLHCAWKLRRVRQTEMGLYRQRAEKMKERVVEHYQRTGKTPKEGFETGSISGDLVLQELLAQGNSLLEKVSRYEQRLFSTMLRCMKELRILQKEELPERVEDDVPNEATGSNEVSGQNEATDQHEYTVQNEATGTSEATAQNEATEAAASRNSSDDEAYANRLRVAVDLTAARLMADLQRRLDLANGMTPKDVA